MVPRSLSPIVLVASLILAATASGQPPAERPLEELREIARTKVLEMKAEFEKDLAEISRILGGLDPSQIDSRQASEARKRLAAWLPAFPDSIVAALGKSTGNLREHLALVIMASRNPRLAGPLLDLVGTADPALDVLVVEVAGFLGAAVESPRVVALASAAGTPPPLLGAALLAAARLKADEAAPLAREHLDHPEPDVRIKALKALAETQASPKEDAAAVIEAAQKDAEPKVREEATRLLGRYPGRDEVLRVLHDSVSGSDPALAEAALAALETKDVASRETSGKYLADAVKGSLPMTLKIRAARLLAIRLGDPSGARVLAKGARDAAEKAPKNVDLQMAAGDQYKDLGAYDDALNFYRRAEAIYLADFKFKARLAQGRCLALQGKFEDARRKLAVDYRNLSGYADDSDFQEMKADPRYRHLFEPETNGK